MQIIEIFSKVSGVRCGIVLIQDKSPQDTYRDWIEKKKKQNPPLNFQDDSNFKVQEIETLDGKTSD